jgi:hypothetical protein
MNNEFPIFISAAHIYTVKGRSWWKIIHERFRDAVYVTVLESARDDVAHSIIWSVWNQKSRECDDQLLAAVRLSLTHSFSIVGGADTGILVLVGLAGWIFSCFTSRDPIMIVVM